MLVNSSKSCLVHHSKQYLTIGLICVLLFNSSNCQSHHGYSSNNNPSAYSTDNCNQPLGLESGLLPDSAITASSSYHEASVGPKQSRLNNEKLGGAWCPAPQLDLDNSGTEWLQINLTDRFVINKISTQG